MKKKNIIFLIITVLCLALVTCSCGGDPLETEDDGELREDGTRVYDVPNAYFTFERYEILSKGPTDIGENFAVISSNVLEIRARCSASLEDVTAIIKLYDADGKLVGNYRATMKNCDIVANESFVLSADISADAKENFNVVDVRFSGKSLERVYRAGDINFNVTFVYNNGTPAKMVVVGLGKAVEAPKTLPEKDGFVFNGWYTDAKCTQLYDFTTSDIDEDLTLYAGYLLNYDRMSEKVLDVAKMSTVKITTKSYSSLLWGAYETSASQKSGEGVIVKDDDENYYILTTYDLLVKDEGYEKLEYNVEDCFGNKYQATLVHSSATSNLGILKISRSNALLVCKLASAAPAVREEIAIVKNIATSGYSPCFGKVLSYDKVEHGEIDGSAHDINYVMMIHDVDTDVRISGRPVFNMNLELVGIQCGTLTKEEIEIERKHAIPFETIQKYIATYGA